MIIRKIEDNKIVIIDVGYTISQEAKFIEKNPTGNFMLVDSLPPSIFQKWKEVAGVIVVDTEEESIVEQAIRNKENRSYLSSTDWYVTRNTETGVEIPADILTKRQTAREAIV